jgi:hypothetical protein
MICELVRVRGVKRYVERRVHRLIPIGLDDFFNNPYLYSMLHYYGVIPD